MNLCMNMRWLWGFTPELSRGSTSTGVVRVVFVGVGGGVLGMMLSTRMTYLVR